MNNIEINQNKIINQITSLSIDMINSSKFGFIQENIDASIVLYNLYANHLIFNKSNSNYLNRDRVIISSSITPALYSTLLVSGFPIELEELINYTKHDIGSPGYPVKGEVNGVDFTSIASNEEVASAVGEAIGEAKLNALFPKLINYKVYCILTSKDLENGSVIESLSLAGKLQLKNLNIIYIGRDNNTNIGMMLQSLGFSVYTVDDITNENINKAMSEGISKEGPSFINIKFGKDKLIEDNLSDDLTLEIKNNLEVRSTPFQVSLNILEDMSTIIGNRLDHVIQDDLVLRSNKELNEFFDEEITIKDFIYEVPDDLQESTYETSKKIIEYLSKYPKVVFASNVLENNISSSNYLGNNIDYEKLSISIAPIMNAISNCGFKTFVFNDISNVYKMLEGITSSSIRGNNTTYVFTTDLLDNSIYGLGNSYIDAISILNDINGLSLYRVADANEVIGAFRNILETSSTNAIALSKKKVPVLKGTDAKSFNNGGYKVRESLDKPYGILISTGRQLYKAIDIANRLEVKGIYLDVVSMPNLNKFLTQTDEYQDEILPVGVRKIVIDSSSSNTWHKLIYDDKYLITIDTPTHSSTEDEVEEVYNFGIEKLEKRVEELLK